jgi:hypothetical protein
MSGRSGITLAALLLLTPATSGATSQYAPAPDDGAVLGAVLAHTIVPTHRRTHGDDTAPVEVQGTSAPLCPGRSGNAAVCRIPDSWHRFLRPDASLRWPGLIGNERTLQDLVASLEARNAEAHTLPLSDVPGIAVVDSPLDTLDRPTGPRDGVLPSCRYQGTRKTGTRSSTAPTPAAACVGTDGCSSSGRSTGFGASNRQPSP